MGKRRSAWKKIGLTIVFAAVLASLIGAFAPGRGYDEAARQNPAAFDKAGGGIFGSIFGSIFDTLAILDIATLFPSVTNTLTVATAGTGGGTVTASPNPDSGSPAINCARAAGVQVGPTCSGPYTSFDGFEYIVTLTAAAGTGSTFTGWSGACSGTATTATVDIETGNKTCTATFAAAPGSFPLTVQKAGTGSGTVTSVPAGIDCGADCGESYTSGTAVTLSAAAGTGSTFTGWSGAGCTGTATCVVTMTQAQTVTATFTAAQTFPLTVTVTGNGAVVSSPVGIGCPSTCTASFAGGTTVLLTAIAAQGSSFQGWTGAGCSGTGTCSVTMSQAQSVSAAFSGGGGGGVQAQVIGTRITKTGPVNRIRQLKVTIQSSEEVRVVLRVRREGVTIQSKRVNGFGPDTALVTMNLRNGIAAGRAQLQVTFTNAAGAQKIQNRGIRLPRLF